MTLGILKVVCRHALSVSGIDLHIDTDIGIRWNLERDAHGHLPDKEEDTYQTQFTPQRLILGIREALPGTHRCSEFTSSGQPCGSRAEYAVSGVEAGMARWERTEATHDACPLLAINLKTAERRCPRPPNGSVTQLRG